MGRAGIKLEKWDSRSSVSAAGAGRDRMLLVEALRAIASNIIVWHHFALYPPLAQWAAPAGGSILEWFRTYG